MPIQPSPSRDARRAQLRQIHGAWLANDIAGLEAARGAIFRGIVPGCAAGVAVAVLMVTLALGIGWPPSWWAHPLSLLRLAAIAAGAVWIARTFLFARPDEGDAALSRQDDQLEDIVRRLFAQIRAGSSYEPRGRLERDWVKPAGFATVGPAMHSAHRLRWRAGDIKIEAGEVEVDVAAAGDPGNGSLRGWVAVATMPEGWKARVRLRPRDTALPASAADDRMAMVEVAALGESYDVRASDSGTAHRLFDTDLVARLRAEAASGRRVHLAVAWRTVVVVVEHEQSWFHRLHHRLDEAHVVMIGETLDLLDEVIAYAARAVTATPAADAPKPQRPGDA
jgi:hypothetical protein